MMVPPSVDKDTAFQRLRHLQSHSGAVVSAEVLDPQPHVLSLPCTLNKQALVIVKVSAVDLPAPAVVVITFLFHISLVDSS